MFQTFRELQILIQIINALAFKDIMKTLLENAKFATQPVCHVGKQLLSIAFNVNLILVILKKNNIHLFFYCYKVLLINI